MNKLALLGGRPVIEKSFPIYNSIGSAEKAAVSQVMESGVLSAFYGSWGDQFFGGPKVIEFEKRWQNKFAVKHAVSVNSATSGLMAAMGAIGIEPGDEVIVPPYTMSATAMAPLIYGGIPIFVDIEPETFCLDLEKVKQAINQKTKGIIAVNLFGHPAKLKELRALADTYNIKLIEDNAQAILATENGVYTGTIGHIGVFSLNYHKHIHCGEGGICITNDDELALRMQMIRNHAENAVEALNIKNISGLVGFNYRMTELSAAIGIEQLNNCETHIKHRQLIAEKLLNGISDLEGIISPKTRNDCSHAYYILSFRVKEDKLGISRHLFSKALAAEGFPHFVGYVRPLYRLPVFQKATAFGNYPFNLTDKKYHYNMCPVAEKMYEQELLCYEICMYDVSSSDIDLLIEAMRKVHHQRFDLKITAEV